MDKFYCDTCEETFPTRACIDDHKSRCSVSREPTAEPGVASVNVDGARRYPCELCEIWTNSKDDLEKHLKGKPHKRKVRERDGAPVDATKWFECYICKRKLNSEQQLDVHLRSHRDRGSSSSSSVSSIAVLTAGVDPITKVKVENTALSDEQSNYIHASIGKISSAEIRNNLNITEDEEVTTEKFYSCKEYLSFKSTFNKSCETSPAPDKSVHSEHPLQKVPLDDSDQTLVKKVWSPNSEQSHREDEKLRKLFDDSDGAFAKMTIAASCDDSRNEGKIPPDTNGGDVQATIYSRSGFYCNLCEVSLNGIKPKEQHKTSYKHMKSVGLYLMKQENKTIDDINEECIVSASSAGPSSSANSGVITVESDARSFPHSHSFCKDCDVPLNSEKDRLAHTKSRKHILRVMLSEAAPERVLPNIVKVDTECEDFSYDLTTTIPRSYQCELFEKAMVADTVCFLPTGTGKTLTGCIMMSYMLKLNPARPVVFLVDRILLVLQQSKYIERMDFNTEQMTKRKLRIAALCGRQQDAAVHALPLWKHDVIVSTAAYFRNLLESWRVRWSDLSLVVFDEVHHCAKDHPFNLLMKTYHLMLPLETRPKILGLTASPAGKKTVEQTEVMLRELLSNLGGAQIAAVEDYKSLLKRHQSSAQLVIREVTLNDEESHLLSEFRKYLPSCYQYLDRDIKVGDMELENAHEIAEEDIQKFTMNMIESLKQKIKNGEVDDGMHWHIIVVCKAYRSLGEYGTATAYERLETLLDKGLSSFERVQLKGFNCEELMRLTRENQMSRALKHDATSYLTTANPSLYPAATMLLTELHDQIDWEKGMKAVKPPIALILVKERVTVKYLENTLKADATLVGLGVKITSITGHGNGSEGGGMTVPKQKQILEEIEQHKYQVIVATSVAEEGLDLPQCELVIQMDPPSTVTSLIQIRGRARRKGGRFVAICRQPGAKEMVDNLLLKEKYMEEACRRIRESPCRDSADN